MKSLVKFCLLTFADDEFSMDMLGGDNEDIFEPTEDGSQEEDADEEIDVSKIFDEENPQGKVGEEDNDNELDDEAEPIDPEKQGNKKGSSPKAQFYSSALKALKDDDVLPDIDDEFIKDATSPEKFAEAIEKQVESRLDSVQKRVNEALTIGVKVDEIKRFENILSNLESITEESLENDDEDAEQLRRNIIYQDLVNRGFKKERALKEVEKSFNAGTDIEDAKVALDGNKEFFTESYNDLIEENRAKERLRKEKIEKDSAELKKKILTGDSPIGLKIDKQSSQKMYDNIVKPIHKNSEGKLVTELQRYSEENPLDAQYFFSLFYTMTDGFKNIDKLVGSKVKQANKRALRELEHVIRNTPIGGDGTVDYSFGSDDQESFVGKNFKLNI